MPGAYLYGWVDNVTQWVKLKCTAEGKLVIDPSEIFENVPTDNEHGKAPDSDWAYDHEDAPDSHHERYTDAEAVDAMGAKADDNPLHHDKFEIPAGCILLWSGAIVDIPDGWLLCNGASGTPDLRDRFIVGAGSAYAPDGTGGSNTMAHTHAGPSHRHTGPSHVHTGPNHRHTGPYHNHQWYNRTGVSAHDQSYNSGGSAINLSTIASKSGGRVALLCDAAGPYPAAGLYTTKAGTGYTSYAGTGNTGAGGTGNTGAGGTEATGAASNTENRPLYYALCYIMKA